MNIDNLLTEIQRLLAEGKVTMNTKVTVAAEPTQDYDRTSDVVFKSTIGTREVIIVDRDSDIWRGTIL
jgi:hypothetical protein